MKKSKQFISALLLMSSWLVPAPVQADMAIIVHPGNPLTTLTANEAAQIYLGKTDVFPDGRRAIPADQTAGSPMRQKFYKEVVRKNETSMKVYWSKLMFSGKGQPPREIGDDAAVKGWTAANPDAMGYIDKKSVDNSVKVLLVLP